jgi:hypothetical protein
MDLPKSEIVGIIFQLLPGFVAAWIFYGFTAHPQKSPFERTIQALIFTGIVKAITVPFGWTLVEIGSAGLALGTWTTSSEFVVSILIGILIGITFSACANTNCIHSFFSNWSNGRITRRTSYPSEWYSAFMRRKRYVYLHLNDGRRVFGWPQEWPDSAASGHFVLMQAEWIDSENRRISSACTECLLIAAEDVKMVEFEIENIWGVPLRDERK